MKQDSLLNVGYITGQFLKPENDYNAKRDNKMSTYQIKNSFNWGFLTGVLFSFLIWVAIFYLFK